MSLENFTFSHKAALALLIFTGGIVLLYLMRPIADPDFFWHLKTGQWILQHQTLPAIDPFSLNPPAADDLRASFILTSYWFSQVIYAAFHALGDWWGIALLRVILVGLLFALFVSRSDLRQPAKVGLFLLVAVQLLEVYPPERPQMFSFIFFAVLLVLLDRYTEQGESDKKSVLFAAQAALLMLFWSNLHGGFLVGQVTLVFFLLMEGGKFLSPSLSPLSRQRYRGLGLIVLAGLLASFLNPNPLNSLKVLFKITDTDAFLYATNFEYYSSWKSFREFGSYTIVLNWLMMALVAGSILASFRRTNITWAALLAGTAIMGCLHVRYMPFFLLAALFYLGKSRPARPVGDFLPTLFVVLTLIVVGWFARDEGRYASRFLRGEWGVEQSFPVRAADFVIQRNLPGPVYNTYLWGGYLLWRLGPERKIFCDGRALDGDRYREFLSTTIVSQSGEPYWKEIFRKNGIQTAIVQLIEPGGGMNPLATSLRRDREWSMVFAKENAAVFIRRARMN